METVIATLLTLACGLIAWGMKLAYLGGRVLAAVELRLHSVEKRLDELETPADHPHLKFNR